MGGAGGDLLAGKEMERADARRAIQTVPARTVQVLTTAESGGGVCALAGAPRSTPVNARHPEHDDAQPSLHASLLR